MRSLPLHGTLGTFTWRMLATVLVGESICLFFGALVARALAATGPDAGRSGTYLVVGSTLAALAIAAAGMLRRPVGVTLGWLVQILTIASAVVLPMMLVVGVLFLALWIVCLVQGARIDRLDAAHAAHAAHGDEPATGQQGAADGDHGADRVTG